MRSIPDIHEISASFPSRYVNDIQGWAFNKKTIEEDKGKLLTLDLDFGERCTRNCPSCFRENNEIFEIYEWDRRRNLYVIVTPTMVSGRAKKQATWKAITPNLHQLVNLYLKISSFNIDNGLQTIKQIIDEGISAYVGGHPCNQVYRALRHPFGGTVLSCPGDVAVEGNIWENSLEEICQKSNNYSRRGVFNNKCVAKDGKSMPVQLYDEVLRQLKFKYLDNVESWENFVLWGRGNVMIIENADSVSGISA